MPLWIVDPDWYFQTAAILGQASSTIASAAGTVASHAELGTNNMAGNDNIGSGWGGKYDTLSKQTVSGAVALSTAWSALAGRIYQAGVNHAWAEFTAGRGRIPSPANLPSRPAISTPADPAMPSAVGDNGPGVAVTLPGLDEAIGSDVPNADTFNLTRTATAWTTFSTAIVEVVAGVIHDVRTPDPSLPDASAFYASIMRVSAPGEALGADAMSLSSLTSSFSGGVTTMRGDIDAELYATAIEISGVAAIAILATRVAGNVSIGVGTRVAQRRINRAGQNIRGYINALQSIASAINSFTPSFQAGMKAILDKESQLPAEGFERNPDGTIKPTIRYFDRAKWEAWQRYLERGGDWDIDRWSQAYDQLKANGANGYWYDQWVAQVMGYDVGEDWRQQYSDPTIAPNRRWDWANIIDGQVVEVVENKSGRLDFAQLGLDEQALQNGVDVTYNINANYAYTASELAALERLQQLYPDQFIVNRI